MAESSDFDLDELLGQYFGAGVSSEERHSAELKRLRTDFNRETNRAKRLALWLVLAMVGKAPNVSSSFAHKTDRVEARTFAELLAIAGRVDPATDAPADE